MNTSNDIYSDNICANDKYEVKIRSDIFNVKEFKNKFVLIEFNYNLFIYDKNNIKIKDISYYDITSWEYGNKMFNITYIEKNDSNKKYKICFNCDNIKNIVNSIRKNVNHLLEFNNIEPHNNTN